jgi:hypothetical protein
LDDCKLRGKIILKLYLSKYILRIFILLKEDRGMSVGGL